MIKIKNNTGFSMIEVLISTVVLSVGILGVAGLQTTGLRNNLTAYHRSQATQLAYDMADRMRANMDDAEKLTASTYNNAVLSPISATVQSGCHAVAGTCSSAQMAANDLFEWNRDLTSILPSGVGLITVAGSTYTIKVNWDDNRDGAINSSDPNFEVSFQL